MNNNNNNDDDDDDDDDNNNNNNNWSKLAFIFTQDSHLETNLWNIW